MDKKILEKNQKALKKKCPKIYKKLLEYDCKENIENDTFECMLLDTRETAKALLVKKENKEIRLNSKYYPLREAKQWAMQFEYQNISVNAIIFGFGNGIFVRELLERLEDDSILCIIEPDYTIFSVIMQKADLSDIISDKRVEIYFYHDKRDKALKRISELISWANLNTTIRTNHPGYDKVYEKEFEEYQIELGRICEKVCVNANTMAFFSESSVYNVIHNLRYIEKSNYINELIGIFPKDYPAIVVSAGPSLIKNIEQLRFCRNKAFVMVVDTAVKVMEENSIPYDAIVLVDPQKPAEFLTKYPNCKDIPLFCLTEAPYKILDFHTGRKVWMSGSVWLEGEYKKYGMNFAEHKDGGSVATVATEMARIIGFKTIILVGQDLAYLGNKTHAGREYAMGEETDSPSEWIEGLNGEMVRSRWDWIHYLHWFEDFTKRHKSDITLIDATEGGALIHGSKVMNLEDVKQKYAKKEFSFREYMKGLPRTFELHDYNPIMDDIKKLKYDINGLVDQCKCGLQYLEVFQEVEEDISMQKLDQSLNNCKELNWKIAKIEGYELIEIGISKLLQDKLARINYISEDEQIEKKNTAQMLMDYYQAVIEVSDKITKEFEKIKIV